MTSASQENPIKSRDWMLANPWFWLGAGTIFALWSWLWTFTLGAAAGDARVIVLAGALLFGAVGVWLRWNDGGLLYLKAWRTPLALLMGCFFAMVGIGVNLLFVTSFCVDDSYGLRPAALFLVWISTTPPCFFAVRRCLLGNGALVGPETQVKQAVEEEVALAFIVLAGICALGSFTLYADRAHPADWDTMRMFVRVMAAICMYAAALALITTGMRRVILSCLFTLHFAGIATAALSAPPAPWIVQQTWVRFFRPYLEFVYLNNAYHFYAPEPGAASYFWFRVIFESPDGQSEEGMWYKVPRLDEDGRIEHPVALEYQRFLSLTEAAAHADSLPPELVFNPESKAWEWNPFYARRVQLAMPNPPTKVGEAPSHQIRIPEHPALPRLQQVWIPNDGSRKLLESYARFLARKFPHHPDPDKSDWKFKSVKIYRVVHWIPPVQWFLNDIPPTDPESYRPYYAGNYFADGRRSEEPDPYRFWLLPNIRDKPNDPDSQIRDYARRHAGDPNWIRRGSDQRWVKSGEEDKN